MTAEECIIARSILQQRGTIPAGHGSKAALCALMGITRPTLDKLEREGTKQRQTDLAYAALIAGVEPGLP